MSRDKDQSWEDLRRQAEQLEVTPSPEAWSRLERKLDRKHGRAGLLVPLRPWLRAAAALLVMVVAAIVLWPEREASETAFASQSVSVEFVSTEPSPGELARIVQARSAYRQSLAWVESADASGGELMALNVAPGSPGILPGDQSRNSATEEPVQREDALPPGNLPDDQFEDSPAGTIAQSDAPGTAGSLPLEGARNTRSETITQASKRKQSAPLTEKEEPSREPSMGLITEDDLTDLPETSLSRLSIFQWMEGEWGSLEKGSAELLVCTYRKKVLTGHKSDDETYFELAFRTTTGGTPALILQPDTAVEKRFNYMGREGDRYFFKSQRPSGTGEELLIEWSPEKKEMTWLFGAPDAEEMSNVPFSDLNPPVDTARMEKWGRK